MVIKKALIKQEFGMKHAFNARRLRILLIYKTSATVIGKVLVNFLDKLQNLSIFLS